MHVAHRWPMAAATVAVIGTTAIAFAPTTPAVSAPKIPSTAPVTMTAFDSPIPALIGTGQMALKYLFKSGYSSDPAANWGTASGIGDQWNTLLTQVHDPVQGYLPHFTSVGLIPDMLQKHLPVLSQFVLNWIGYGGDLMRGDFTKIGNDIRINAHEFAAQLRIALPEAKPTFTHEKDQLLASIADTRAAIKQALQAGDIQGAWNSAVTGWLSPDGVPGKFLNLTIGSGTYPVQGNVQSIRLYAEAVGQALTDALRTASRAPKSASAQTVSSAAYPQDALAASSAGPLASAGSNGFLLRRVALRREGSAKPSASRDSADGAESSHGRHAAPRGAGGKHRAK